MMLPAYAVAVKINMKRDALHTPLPVSQDAESTVALRKVVLRMDPAQVYFLKFILEGYDNLFMLSTVDKKQGVMLLQAAEGTADELDRILDSLRERIGLKCTEMM